MSQSWCLFLCLSLANIEVNVDLDLVEDTSPKFGGKVPKQELL